MAKSRIKRPARRRARPAPKKIQRKPHREAANQIKAFQEALLRDQGDAHYVLRLYVTGTSPRSAAAITNIRRLCEQHLKGRYDLEVIDIYQQPVLARGEQIIAAPTLIKKFPFPLRKVVGDLSNAKLVLMGLDIRPKPAAKNGSDA